MNRPLADGKHAAGRTRSLARAQGDRGAATRSRLHRGRVASSPHPMLADEGWSTTKIAQQLRVDPNTVSRWRGRIAAAGVGQDVRCALADAPRSGRPRSIDAVRRAQIVATACDPVPDAQGLSRCWTLDQLKEELPLRGIRSAQPQQHRSHPDRRGRATAMARNRCWQPSTCTRAR